MHHIERVSADKRWLNGIGHAADALEEYALRPELG